MSVSGVDARKVYPKLEQKKGKQMSSNVNEYLELNDAAKMNMAAFISKAKTAPEGDREIVFERAQKFARQGVDLKPLLTGLKATFK